jgi:hypothetical protein
MWVGPQLLPHFALLGQQPGTKLVLIDICLRSIVGPSKNLYRSTAWLLACRPFTGVQKATSMKQSEVQALQPSSLHAIEP